MESNRIWTESAPLLLVSLRPDIFSWSKAILLTKLI